VKRWAGLLLLAALVLSPSVAVAVAWVPVPTVGWVPAFDVGYERGFFTRPSLSPDSTHTIGGYPVLRSPIAGDFLPAVQIQQWTNALLPVITDKPSMSMSGSLDATSVTVGMASWQYEASMGAAGFAGISSAWQSSRVWGFSSGTDGWDFGISHEPALVERDGTNSYDIGEHYGSTVHAAVTGNSGQNCVVYRRAAIRAWGGKEAAGTYWYKWRATYSYGVGAGGWSDSIVLTGSVVGASAPPNVTSRHNCPPWGNPRTAMGSRAYGMQVYLIGGGLPGGYSQWASPATVLPVDVTYTLLSGLKRGVDVTPANLDLWGGAIPDSGWVHGGTLPSSGEPVPPPTASEVASAAALDASAALGVVQIPSWIPGADLLTSWFSDMWGRVSAFFTSGLSGALGGLFYPFTAFGGFK